MIDTINVTEEVADAGQFTIDELKELAKQALSRPAESGWSDEELWHTHTLMFSTPAWHLTDDYTVGEANYRAVLRDYSEKYPDDVSDASFGHWTYSSFSCIKVRVVTENGDVTMAFAELMRVAKDIEEQYPLYDDEMHSQLESEKFESYLDAIILDRDRYRDEVVDEVDDEWNNRFREFIYEHGNASAPDDLVDEVIKLAVQFADSKWTMPQYNKITNLCDRYKEAFKFSDYRRWDENASMTKRYVEGWVGGVTTTIYVGVSPEGDSHS